MKEVKLHEIVLFYKNNNYKVDKKMIDFFGLTVYKLRTILINENEYRRKK